MIQMSNNLTSLLISDTRQTKCAASITVNCGFINDDINISGLAHLVEHMVMKVKI